MGTYNVDSITDRFGERHFEGPYTLSKVHEPTQCFNDQGCSIHNPSDHKMVDWPRHWRDDQGVMERLCKHGVGHPDPDDTAYWVARGLAIAGIHGCDGCCT